MQLLRMFFTDDSRFTDARTPFLIVYFLTQQLQLLNVILVSDATLISSTDSRLSDARTL
jgi:hypothetical protein